MNWAPLAPGSDPVLLGESIGDGTKIDEGLPIFSALTGFWYGTFCGPAVWPMSILDYSAGCTGR